MDKNDEQTPGWLLDLAIIAKRIYAGPLRHNILSIEEERFSQQRYVHGSLNRGFCRVLWNESSIVVAFRGTRERNDWEITNLKFFPERLRDCDDCGQVSVHRGFQQALNYIDRTSGLNGLSAITSILSPLLEERQLFITGHSLGGALATLFAVKLRAKIGEVASAKTNIVSFGAPPVGGGSFSDYYGALSDRTIRVVNRGDPVPFLHPPGFQHIGRLLQVGVRSAEEEAARGLNLSTLFPFSISDHSMESYIVTLKKLLN